VQDSLPAGGLRLYREGVEPSGSLRKVSGYISILLSRTSPVARVVYAKPPFAGPEAVLAYLSRYTHRVAISNRRLISLDENGATFRYKEYRRDGAERYRTMTLPTDEFIRRFLLHVLPKGFHRIRHYGLLASATRKANVARIRQLLAVPAAVEPDEPVEPTDPRPPCPCCGGRMTIIETFQRGMQPRAPPASPVPTGTVTP
jgi:Putative transposase